MLNDPHSELELVVTPVGRGTRATVVVKPPVGTPFCNKIDLANEVARRRLVAQIVKRFPGAEPEDLEDRLAKEATELVCRAAGDGGADEADAADARQAASLADEVFALVLERFEVCQDERRQPYLVMRGGPNIALPFKGNRHELEAEIAAAYVERHGRVPSGAALTDALRSLHGRALREQPTPTFLRIAEHEGALLLDLGDASGAVIELTSRGWRRLERSPVPFYRTALTTPLPEPQKGGSIELFRQLLNVKDRFFALLIGWLIALLFPRIQKAILLFGGLHGTGKSKAAEYVRNVFDPSESPLLAPSLGQEDWAVMAAAQQIVVVDNISRIQLWWSDSLCRATSGETTARRARFSDSDIALLRFRRAIILTSIDPGALRGDLGDRLVLVDMKPISPRDRRLETELDLRFEQSRSLIMGALLDIAVQVLRILPEVRVEQPVRLADFHRVLAAVDQVLGTDAAKMLSNQRLRIAWAVIESDAVAQALYDLVLQKQELELTAGEILERIKPMVDDHRHLPKTPGQMGGRIRRVLPALAEVGVEVIPPSDENRRGKERDRIFSFRWLGQDGEAVDEVEAETASAASAASASPGEDTGPQPEVEEGWEV